MSEGLYKYPPMPPVPAEDFPVEEEPRGVSRRGFLRAGAIGAASLYAGNTVLARLLDIAESKQWPGNEPSFSFINGETYHGQTELGIFLPGFGDMDGKAEAELWSKTSQLPKTMLTGCMDYSNEGTDIETMVQLVRNQVDMERIQSVSIFGRSIGGLYSLPFAAELGVPVRSLVLCSSPSSLSNGDFGNFGRLVAGLPQNQELATGGKFLVNTWRSLTGNGYRLRKASQEGWAETMSGANPLALQRELKTANGIDIWDPQLTERLGTVFIPGFSKVVYAATNNPSTDQTVIVVASGTEFQRRFETLGVTFDLRGLEYDGHANVHITAADLRGWTQAAIAPTIAMP